jgi:acetyltransferase
VDLEPADFINYFVEDVDTDVIGFYLEGVPDGTKFLAALRKAAVSKPVVILKGGRTAMGAKAVSSHTNSLSGEYTIWKTAVQQAGGLMVDDFDTFMAVLTAFQKNRLVLTGDNIALIGNGGGATVLATDAIEECGLKLANLNNDTKDAIQQLGLPPGSTLGNPTDTPVNALSKSGGNSLGSVANYVIKDSTVNGIILHFNLVPLVNYENWEDISLGLSSAIRSLDHKGKPVFIVLRLTSEPLLVDAKNMVFNAVQEMDFPCFHSLKEAIFSMACLRQLNNRPVYLDQKGVELSSHSVSAAQKIISKINRNAIRIIPQDLAFDILGLFGIRFPKKEFARNYNEAKDAAAKIGYPVVMKIESPDIIHKSDIGGVLVGLKNDLEVEKGFQYICNSVREKKPEATISGVFIQRMSARPVLEMICGLKKDPVFGVTVILGLGGVFVETMKKFAIRIWPFSKEEAHDMWKDMPWANLLTGYRGKPPLDTFAMEELALCVAAMGEAIPDIIEMDLNPVMVLEQGKGIEVADCRIIIKQS